MTVQSPNEVRVEQLYHVCVKNVETGNVVKISGHNPLPLAKAEALLSRVYAGTGKTKYLEKN